MDQLLVKSLLLAGGVVLAAGFLAGCEGGSASGGAAGEAGASNAGGSPAAGGASSSTGGSGNAAGGAQNGTGGQQNFPPLAVIDGIEIPGDLELCGNITAGVGSSYVEFSWSGVSEATRYAVEARKKLGEFTEISADDLVFSGIQEEASYRFEEKASGYAYRVDVYALEDETPLCVLSGFNGAGPF